jgi:hypothetical protein
MKAYNQGILASEDTCK